MSENRRESEREIGTETSSGECDVRDRVRLRTIIVSCDRSTSSSAQVLQTLKIKLAFLATRSLREVFVRLLISVAAHVSAASRSIEIAKQASTQQHIVPHTQHDMHLCTRCSFDGRTDGNCGALVAAHRKGAGTGDDDDDESVPQPVLLPSRNINNIRRTRTFNAQKVDLRRAHFAN